MRCASNVSAYLSTTESGSVAELQREEEDRLVGGIHLAPGGRTREIGRKPAERSGDRCLHVLRRSVDVAVEHELERDLRGSERVQGGHRVDAGDRREGALERRRDGGGHRLGIGAGQGRRHEQRREVHVRQVADRQLAVGGDTEQQQRAHQERRHHRAPDERLGDVHGRGSGWPATGPGAASMRTWRTGREAELSVGDDPFARRDTVQRAPSSRRARSPRGRGAPAPSPGRRPRRPAGCPGPPARPGPARRWRRCARRGAARRPRTDRARAAALRSRSAPSARSCRWPDRCCCR